MWLQGHSDKQGVCEAQGAVWQGDTVLGKAVLDQGAGAEQGSCG